MRKGNKLISGALSAVMLATGFAGIPMKESDAAEYRSMLMREETEESMEISSPLDASASYTYQIDEKTFPDKTFRKYIEDEIDTNKDGSLSSEEIQVVTSMDFYDTFEYEMKTACSDAEILEDIYDLKGIEIFSELVYLDCSHNKLSKLDISKLNKLTYLDCSYNDLSFLDVSRLCSLEELRCSENRLSALDLRALKNLMYIDCERQGYKNTNGNYIWTMSSLTITGLEEILYLDCDFCKLMDLDVTGLKNLEQLSCYNCGLYELKVVGLSKLQKLTCSSNNLIELNLEGLDSLEELLCSENKLTRLDLNSYVLLKRIQCRDNMITDLKVGKLDKLTELDCQNNMLANLSINSQIEKWRVSCENQKIYVSSRKIKLSEFENFDVSKVSSISGASLDGDVLTIFEDRKTAQYKYDCGNGTFLTCEICYHEIPNVVQNIKAEETQQKDIFISWDDVTDATCYYIYRRNDGTLWTKIAETKNVSYRDVDVLGGVTYYYTVAAVNELGISNYENIGVAAQITSLPDRTILRNVEADEKSIKVTWEKTPTASSYYVYRHAKGESWKKIGISTTTSYTDQTAVGGVNYAYTVKAVNGNGASASYDKQGLIAKITARPGKVTLIGATVGKTAIKITWNKVATAKSYNVYRHAKGESWTKIGTSTTTSYIDQTAVGGKNYAYTVKAVNGNGASTSYDTKGIIAKIIALPPITTLIGATAYTGYINVQWKATATASSYNIYRKTQGGKYTRIGTTTKTAFNDKTAVKGTTYYYTVIAVNGNGSCKTYDQTGVKATAK